MNSLEIRAKKIEKICCLNDKDKESLLDMIDVFSVFLSLNDEYTYNETYLKANIDKFIDYSDKYKRKREIVLNILSEVSYSSESSVLICLDSFWKIQKGILSYSDGLENIGSNFICIEIMEDDQIKSYKYFNIYDVGMVDIINYIKKSVGD